MHGCSKFQIFQNGVFQPQILHLWTQIFRRRNFLNNFLTAQNVWGGEPVLGDRKSILPVEVLLQQCSLWGDQTRWLVTQKSKVNTSNESTGFRGITAKLTKRVCCCRSSTHRSSFQTCNVSILSTVFYMQCHYDKPRGCVDGKVILTCISTWNDVNCCYKKYVNKQAHTARYRSNLQ